MYVADVKLVLLKINFIGNIDSMNDWECLATVLLGLTYAENNCLLSVYWHYYGTLSKLIRLHYT